mgnify:CR=1 FL=1
MAPKGRDFSKRLFDVLGLPPNIPMDSHHYMDVTELINVSNVGEKIALIAVRNISSGTVNHQN